MLDPTHFTFATGVLESGPTFSLADALAAWRREAHVGVCHTGRYQCRFFVWGEGQPLLFVHGMSDQARCFVPLIAHLKSRFRCIAYELPNGVTDGAKLGQIRHADLVADLFELLDHLRISQLALYGGSFGSTVALAALVRQPQRFLRAAVHGAFARRRLAPAERILANFARHWRGRLRELPLRSVVQRHADAPAFATAVPEAWSYQRANTSAAPLRAVAHRALLIDELDLRPLLRKITQPIMLVTGDRDSLVGQAAKDELLNGMPHADCLEFQNCGHYPQYTHTAGLAEALKRFLLPPCGLSG